MHCGCVIYRVCTKLFEGKKDAPQAFLQCSEKVCGGGLVEAKACETFFSSQVDQVESWATKKERKIPAKIVAKLLKLSRSRYHGGKYI